MTERTICPIKDYAKPSTSYHFADPLTVLLVESDQFHAALAESRLERLSQGRAQVVQVDTLAAALLYLAQNEVDAVLVNPNLWDSRGIDSIIFLLQQALDIPLVILCDEKDEPLALEAIGLGAQDYVIRDRLARENLLRIIRHSRERHQLQLQLERKIRAIELMRRRFRSLVDDNADGMVVVDQDGIVNYANPAAHNLLSQEADSLIGDTFGLPLEGAGSSEVDIVRPEGDAMIAEIRVMKTAWDGVPAYIASLRDITRRKQNENDLRLAEANAKQAASLKSLFLANMSHELRTPLNSIIGFADLLRLEVHGKIGDSRYNQYLDIIGESGRALLTLVNNLLDLSKVEAGRLELSNRRLDLGLSVTKALEEAGQAAEISKVELITEVEPGRVFLWADVDRIEQVLRAVLSNSLRFTGPGGEIRFAVREGAGGGLVLSVSDTGSGIAPDEIPLVFEAFGRQSDAYTRTAQTGPGLGLAIAKQLIELHGGKIMLDSTLGHGTTVSIYFPADRLMTREAKTHLRLVGS